MALYDYKCVGCDTTVAISHPISDTPEIICADCQGIRIKVFSAPAVSFKGGGWGHQA